MREQISETGRGPVGPFFLWHIFWPLLLDDTVALCVQELGPAGKLETLFVSGTLTFLILYPFYRRWQGQMAVTEKKRFRRWAERLFYGGKESPASAAPEGAGKSAPGNPCCEGRNAGGRRWVCGGKRGQAAAAAGLLLAAAAAVSLFLNLLFKLADLYRFFPLPEETGGSFFGAPVILQFLVMALVSPLEEELIFRGVVYGRLREIMGIFPAALVSAAFFGLVHGNAAQGLFAGILGLALAFIYERCGGLAPAVWFHAGANGASILLAAAMPEALQQGIPGVLLLAFSGAVALAGLVKIFRQGF